MEIQLQDPLRFTVAVQMTPAIVSVTVTSLPTSPVPLNVGVLSFKKLPSTGDWMLGAAGAEVSTVNATPLDGALAFPAASVEIAVTL